MSLVNVTLHGTKGVEKNLRGLGKNINAEIKKAVDAGARNVRDTARDLIRKKPSKYRKYRIGTTKGGRGRFHYSSAPGDAPNKMTGNLMKFITVIKASSGNKPTAYVVSKAEYTLALEFGSRKRNIEPRPFMRPALKRNAESIKAAVATAITLAKMKTAAQAAKRSRRSA